MVYGGILAGGVGSRMGSDIPKQFIMVKDKPVIIHTIEKFLNVEEVDCVVVAVLPEWMDYTEDLIANYLDTHRIKIIAGGKNRSESLLNVCKFIGEESSDILVSHDACRPFVTERIIEDNIREVQNYDAVGTFIPQVDTLAVIKNGILVDVPPRDSLYDVQTPQTFRVCDFVACYNSLSISDKDKLTDATKVFLLNGKRVGMVKGDPSNIKLTNLDDMDYADFKMGRQKSIGDGHK